VGSRAAIVVALAAFVSLVVVAPAGAMDLGRLIAPPESCPNQGELNAPAGVQEEAMRCMTDFARQHMGMAGLVDADDLDRSAAEKSGDILRCDNFSHYACGRDFTYWMQRVGYIPARCWRAGENIAWGSGDLGTVRSIFRAWIHSPPHLENILGPFSQLGIGLQVGNLEGHSNAHVWTQHFGSHCGPAPRPAAPRREKLAAASAVAPAR
jgi:uncharacterized protein YkwD